MKLNRVLIITKPAGRTRKRDLAAIERTLDRMGICYATADRFDIPRVRGFDLVISFGGDGTFLAAAHKAGDAPMLGVNAAPDHSVGFFCAATLKTFDRIIAKIAADRMRPKEAPLIEARVEGRRIPCLALNDLLFAGPSPAETARYELAAGGKKEEQKSSGVWISAGPGSSAAISSAGGVRMPIFSRRLQFLVREPCPRPGSRYRLRRGVLSEGSAISILSHMRTGRLYVDGHWHTYPVKAGERVVCRLSHRTLSIFL